VTRRSRTTDIGRLLEQIGVPGINIHRHGDVNVRHAEAPHLVA